MAPKGAYCVDSPKFVFSRAIQTLNQYCFLVKLLIPESENSTNTLNFGYRQQGAIAMLTAKILTRVSEKFTKY